MSWQDRLQPTMKMTSPGGVEFNPLWSGDKRTVEKKLGIFEFPKIRGALIQDLDVGPVKYPLNFCFEGADHDVTADKFFKACYERGVWTVIHPVLGSLKLQLISVTEENQPVTSGNITQISSEWLEPGINLPMTSISAAQLASKVVAQKDAVMNKATDQLAKMDISKPTLLSRVKAFTAKLQAGLNKALGYYSDAKAVVSDYVSAATSLIGAVTAIVQAPAMLVKDIKSQFNYYKKVLTSCLNELGSAFKELGALVGIGSHGSATKAAAARNCALVTEAVVAAVLTGMAQSVVDADFQSREEAVGYIDQISQTLDQAMTGLDAAQATLSNQYIDQQYFSMSDAYGDLVKLVQLTNQLILRRSFDLAAVRYITLQSNRVPLEIALTEGMDLDLFISANQLKGDDILLLPAGRRVAVYL